MQPGRKASTRNVHKHKRRVGFQESTNQGTNANHSYRNNLPDRKSLYCSLQSSNEQGTYEIEAIRLLITLYPKPNLQHLVGKRARLQNNHDAHITLFPTGIAGCVIQV